jgi:hypothetical protein
MFYKMLWLLYCNGEVVVIFVIVGRKRKLGVSKTPFCFVINCDQLVPVPLIKKN